MVFFAIGWVPIAFIFWCHDVGIQMLRFLVTTQLFPIYFHMSLRCQYIFFYIFLIQMLKFLSKHFFDILEVRPHIERERLSSL